MMLMVLLLLIGGCQETPVDSGNEENGITETENGGEVDEEESEEMVDPSMSLIGTSWQLEYIEYEKDERLFPEHDELYVVYFKEESTSALNNGSEEHYSLWIEANCNTCDGSYKFEEENGSFEVAIGCTRAVCGVFTDFSEAFQATNQYTFDDQGKLVLNFTYIADASESEHGILVFKHVESTQEEDV